MRRRVGLKREQPDEDEEAADDGGGISRSNKRLMPEVSTEPDDSVCTQVRFATRYLWHQ